MYKVKYVLLLLAALNAQTVIATENAVPEIGLLEFLGTIAGLESMGVDIDLLLDDPELKEVVVISNENDE